VAFGLTVPGRNRPVAERRERVARMLKAVRMEAYAERKPNQLSGGQQQRVALARALVIEPSCLLLDEPLSNLDAKLRLDMRLEIRRLVKQTGITAVYVTHDQEEALSMADRCAILRDGRVAQVGTPRELYRRPANRFVADFIGGANLIRGTVRAGGDGELRVATAFGDWTVGAPAVGFQTGQRVVLSVRQEAVRVPAPADRAVNVFPARLSETMFFGDRLEYRLTLPDGQEIKALAFGTERAEPPAGAVSFQVDPADALPLPDA
jgi:ABC-type Fe3+/spermidine/putrescine transport system ATPase subunit